MQLCRFLSLAHTQATRQSISLLGLPEWQDVPDLFALAELDKAAKSTIDKMEPQRQPSGFDLVSACAVQLVGGTADCMHCASK